jgi:hypothetical protein
VFRLRPLTARLGRGPVRFPAEEATGAAAAAAGAPASRLGAEEIKIEKLHIGRNQNLVKIPTVQLQL